MKYHRLLARQLKKSGLVENVDPKTLGLLEFVNRAYAEFDSDMEHMENTLEESSQELFEANQQLQSNVETVSRRLDKVAGNIRDVIFEMDNTGQWTYLNMAWKDLTGCTVEESLGAPYHACLKDRTGESIGDFLGLDEGLEPLHGKKFEITSCQGELKWLDMSIKPLYSSTGKKQGYIGTIVDITQLKNTEFALIAASELANKASKAKDDFLSTMSHEIRTPLNAVIGITNLLLIENPKIEQLENLSALKDSSSHLLELVNDILDFNKIASGSLVIEKRSFDLKDTVLRLQNIFSQRVKERGIDFNLEIDDKLPHLVVGDSTRISQILTNLIGNAIKFTEKGSVSVSIAVTKQTKTQCSLDFAVKDTGIGIRKDRLKDIFKTFEQADPNVTRKYGGSGLGLAICRRLLELMDSDLYVESTLGIGSIFSFSLNLAKDSMKPILSTSSEIHPNNTEVKQSLKGTRILVAEDNKVNTMVIKKFLTKWEANFDLAANGRIAIQRAEKVRYDLILMDLQMPEVDGFQATKAIRESNKSLNRNIPIYALSASTGMYSQKDMNTSGMDGLITKPFNPEELRQTLFNILNRDTPRDGLGQTA
ncbi:MAG: ATP-binding protein [Bacteroidota bacterium]